MSAPFDATSREQAPVAIDTGKLRKRLQALRTLDAQEHDLNRDLEPSLHCAATLVEFDPRELLLTFGLKAESETLARLYRFAETVRGDRACSDGEPPPGPWRLDRAERTRVARDAGIEKLRSARDRLPGSESAAQRVADALLFGTLPELSVLPIADLAALDDVCSWYVGVIESLPSADAVRSRLAMARLLEPMRRLVGNHFVGRTTELGRLTDYVDVLGPRKVAGLEALGRAVRYLRQVRRTLIDNPPVYVFGPGGVGKSSLLARFILNHVDGPQGADLPFVMLDFDRAQVEPRMPLSLLVAALHQLRVQFPQHESAMRRMAEHLAQVMRGTDGQALESGDSLQEALVADFAAQVNEMMGGDEDPRHLLWVLDTFEEPQRMGESTVGALWELMNSLQQHLSRLRLVVCGRAVPRGFKWDLIPLDEFDDESARAYLRNRLEEIGAERRADDKTLAQTIKVVGRTPLALRLAARLLAAEDHRLLTLKLKREHVQGILFHRVLEHIRVDAWLNLPSGRFRVDDLERHTLEQELSRLVFPGLAVRRITPGVIEHVLAGTCGVKLRDATHVERLFAALAQQVDIVESGDAGAEPSLLHRTDVRRMMLRDLEHEAGERLIRRIDRRAVIYHAGVDSLPSRAEEIYHRLRRQQSEKTIRTRWEKGVEAYLTTALDEIVEPATRLLLAELLDVTLNQEDLANAEYDGWERQAMRRASDYLRAGSPERALSVLAERDRTAASSPLLRLEAQVQQQLGRFDVAADAALRALEAAEGAADFGAAAEAALLLALTLEATGELESAAERLEQAREWTADLANGQLLLRILAATMRLARKRGATFEEIADSAQYVSALLDRETMRELRSRPAVLRELLAEMGVRDSRLLRLGLIVLGVDLPSEEATDGLAESLARWAQEAESVEAVLDLARAHGVLATTKQIQSMPTRAQWAHWLWSASPKEVGALVADVIAIAPHEAVMSQLADLFRSDVDRRITRGRRQRSV